MGGEAGNNESESEWILNNFGHREGREREKEMERRKLIYPASQARSAGQIEVSAGH